MENIKENLSSPVRYKCGCFVAGGGFAGISAALAAARGGADVLLCEKEFILGGLGTAGIVTYYLPLCDGNGTQVSFGIAEELLKLSIKYGAEADFPDAWLGENQNIERRKEQRYRVRYNPGMFALLAEKLLTDAGVKILYGTSVCAVAKDGDRITHVLIENKSGRSAVEVEKCVIDCTGDADVAEMSGAKTEIFKMGNSLAAWNYTYSDSEKVRLNVIGCSDSAEDIESGKSTTALVDRRYTGLDGMENSEMTITAHSFILRDILKRKQSDFSTMPVTLPTIPQIRMTRRICGVYTMCDKEIGKTFDNSVGMFSDWRKRGPVYEMPFSSLYGKEVKNLICAGRCVSSDDNMWDITRVIPVCAVSGEAAGTAAAIISDSFENADIKELQKRLVSAGVKLHA